MILVDTSVWVDHLRAGDSVLARLLSHGLVLAHPWVIGELALGNLARRDGVIRLLRDLPKSPVATDDEIMGLIARRGLFGLGIGYVDAQLLASTLLTAGARLLTRDRHLAAVASRLGCAADPA